MRTFTRSALVLGAALSLATAAFAGAALADGSAAPGVIRKSGSCTNGSTWKLKIKPDDGRIESEFEVDQNVNGAKWHVVLRNDGVKFFEGDRTTRAPSGSFSLTRFSTNGTGPDRIAARARNLATGEICGGAATLP